MLSIKEMATVIDMMAIHPSTTLLGGEGAGLSSTVHMSDEQAVAMHGYLTNNETLDIERYYQAIKHAA